MLLPSQAGSLYAAAITPQVPSTLSAWRAMFVSYSCARSPAACSLSKLASLVATATILCPTQAYLAALQDPGHLAGADLFSDISALPAASSSGTQPSAGASDSTHNRQQDPTASALVTELHESSWTLPSGQAASTDTATASGSLGLQTQPAQSLDAAFAAAQGQHRLSVTMELQVNSPAVSALCHDCSHRCCVPTHRVTPASSWLRAPAPWALITWCLPRFCLCS